METTKSRPRSVRPSSLWAGMAIGIALALGGLSIGAAAGLTLPLPRTVVTEAVRVPQAPVRPDQIRDEVVALRAAQTAARTAVAAAGVDGPDQIRDEVVALRAAQTAARTAAVTAPVAGSEPVGSGRYR